MTRPRRRLRVSRAARGDLTDITRFTIERWGDRQAKEYLAKFEARFESLVRSPRLGRPYEVLGPGVWRSHVASHVIFYRFDAQTLDVVRVLHQRMLAGRHFRR